MKFHICIRISFIKSKFHTEAINRHGGVFSVLINLNLEFKMAQLSLLENQDLVK